MHCIVKSDIWGQSISGAFSLRKSFVPNGAPVTGNGAKYLSYREAWGRIKLVSRWERFLEAVTLEGRIISDRLLSFLEKRCGPSLKGGTRGSFNQIVQKRPYIAATLHESDPAEIEALNALEGHLHTWRNGRNEVVRGIVKSKASHRVDHIGNFFLATEAHARTGEKLDSETDAWVRWQGKPKYSS